MIDITDLIDLAFFVLIMAVVQCFFIVLFLYIIDIIHASLCKLKTRMFGKK